MVQIIIQQDEITHRDVFDGVEPETVGTCLSEDPFTPFARTNHQQPNWGDAVIS